MEFNAKFFIIALIVSLAAGIVGNIYLWLHYLPDFTTPNIMTIRIFLAPITQAFCIIFPFIIMYLQAEKISQKTNLIPILINAFLGTWIGQIISDIGIQTFIVYYTGGHYVGYNIFEFAIGTTWQIIVLAFSPTIFILTTAILLAHYQEWKKTQLPQPPI